MEKIKEKKITGANTLNNVKDRLPVVAFNYVPPKVKSE